MIKVPFYKLQASGNDFILVSKRKLNNFSDRKNLRALAKKCCNRKVSIGADGLLVVERSPKFSFRMRIFNPDGSEAEMCGNGARCAALWFFLASRSKKETQNVRFDTRAGIIESAVQTNSSTKKDCFGSGLVRIKMTNPFGLRYNLPISIFGRKIKVNYINTGVPHVVLFVEGLRRIDVDRIGESVRFHKKFSPAGTNVNFVEILGKSLIDVRTYERGVGETLACGTGAVASAIVAAQKLNINIGAPKISVATRSGEVLRVNFSKSFNDVSDVWLQGLAQLVYKGEFYI